MTEDYQWDTANSTKIGKYLTRKEMKFIDDFLDQNRENINICLDVACGSGRFSIPISQYGIDVVAVDIDLIPLRKLNGKSEEIMVARGDANSLPFKNSSFDCIISIETIDYIDATKVLKEYKRLIKEDGFLIISTSNRYSYKRFIHRILSSYKTFYRYSFREIRFSLEEAGFNVVDSWGYNWLPFRRGSNSILVGAFELIENILQFGRFKSISPWVIMAAKNGEHE